MPAGAPSKFSDELVQKAQDYLDGEWKDDGSVIPSAVGLALHMGIAQSTLYKWVKEEGKERLSEILSNVNSEQQRLLLNNGLNSTFNPAITKLVLGKHGYSEKQENTVQGPGGSPFAVTFRGVSNDRSGD